MPSRRAILAGGAAAVGGLGLGAVTQVRAGAVAAADAERDTWPMERYDAANRGANPDASAPTDPAVAWVERPLDPDAAPLTGLADRGPSLVAGRDAVYAAGGGLAALSRDDGTVAWRESLPCGTVAAHGARVYAGVHPQTGDDGSGTRYEDPGETATTVPPSPDRLVAVDADEGGERWSVPVGTLGVDHVVVGASSAFAGGRHGLASVTRDGSRRWLADGGGLAGRPGIAEGRLYAAREELGRYEPRTVLQAALDDPPSATWTTANIGHASPPLLTDGVAVGVNQWPGPLGGRDPVAGVTLDEGVVRWFAGGIDAPGAEYARMSKPAVQGDLTFVGATTGGDEGPPERRLLALTTRSGEREWTAPWSGVVAAVGDAVLVGGSRDGTPAGDGDGVVALDPATGEERWRVALDAPVTALAPVDGAVFAATADGGVAAIR